MIKNIYNNRIPPLKNNPVFWGTVGLILFIGGTIGTLALAVRSGNVLYGLIITGILVIAGALIISWAYGGLTNEYQY